MFFFKFRSLVTRLEPANFMNRILMMTMMKSWRLISSSSKVRNNEIHKWHLLLIKLLQYGSYFCIFIYTHIRILQEMICHDVTANFPKSLPALRFVTSTLTTWTRRHSLSSPKVEPFFVFPPKRHCICCHPSIQSGELPSTYSLTGYSHSLSFVPFSSTVMSWLNQNPSKSFK